MAEFYERLYRLRTGVPDGVVKQPTLRGDDLGALEARPRA